MIKLNAINIPKRIDPVSPTTHLEILKGIAFIYLNKVADLGIINIEKGRNYPVCLIIEGDVLRKIKNGIKGGETGV
jgi:hypothetical protein